MDKVEKREWLDKIKNYNLPTPFKVTDLNVVANKVEQLTDLLPDVGIYYALKSCSSKEIINALDDKLSGYDIASLGEFEYLKNLGVAPERMLYSNPVKAPRHIAETYKHGVRNYAFDSLDEIKKLAEHAPDAETYLRVKVSDYGSKFPLSSKFGIEPLHAVPYVGAAEEHGLRVKGLSFHVGSQSENPRSWETAFETCGDIINRLKRNGTNIEFVNIGGGFPANYAERIAGIEHIAETINKSIKRYIPEGIKIIAEPGRFITAEASVIVTSVIGREQRGSSSWIYLDMGVFQGLIEPLEMPELRYPIFTDYPDTVQKHPVTLTGPTCDAFDTIGFDYNLPKALQIGDRLYIGTTGAYTDVYASNFNGFAPPRTEFIKVKKEKK